MTHQSDPVSNLQPIASFVVFDPHSGTILHTHQVSSVAGAIVPRDDELVQFILDHAAHATGRHAKDLDCLKVAGDDLKPRTTYRVDVGVRRLVETSRHDRPHGVGWISPVGDKPG